MAIATGGSTCTYRPSWSRNKKHCSALSPAKCMSFVWRGAWCGDCAEQCPIFTVFEEASPLIHVRYVDRDAHPELKETLTICGGARVPQVVFFSEDMQQVGRYGDRTLAKYRQIAASIGGAACSSGILGETNQHAEVVREWLDEFERIQLILRTSPRLRQKHSD